MPKNGDHARVSSEPDPRDWTGHVIVCGLHGVGLLTVEQLVRLGRQVIVVDDRAEPRPRRAVEAWGVPLLNASARDPDVLDAAGLPGALAVVCVQRDDVETLETALLVHERRPDVRLAVAMDNPAVGRGVTEVTGPGTVLDTAGLAAPSVVEACRQRSEHVIELSGVTFVVTELVAPRTQSLRRQFGDLAPIAVAPRGGGPLAICPGRDHLATAGDRVTVIATRSDLAEQSEPDSVAERRKRRARRLSRLRSAARAMWDNAVGLLREVDGPLRAALVTIVALVVVSTVVVRLGYRTTGGGHIGWLDALYFTVSTDATVGYGDFHFAGQPQWLVTFGVVDIVLGAAMATTVFALATNLLVSRRLAQALGRKRVTGMSGHVVLIGLGSVGMRVLTGLLAAHRDVVVVEADDDGRFVSQARALGAPVVIGDATLPQTLDLVNLDAARSVAVMTSNDLTNLEIALALRDRLERPGGGRRRPLVLRLFDRGLAESVERSFGFRHVRSTSALAAPWFVGAALGLDVLDTFYVEQQPFLLARLTVAAGGGLDGSSMQQLSARTRVIALDRARGGLEHPPRRGTRFAAGDAAYLVGPYEELLDVLQRDQSPADL
jgi:Trk K+ transport system NAD-binding subunit